MGADGHYPQPAQAVQGDDGNGLRVLLRNGCRLADQFAEAHRCCVESEDCSQRATGS
jgi:hypothetical protein